MSPDELIHAAEDAMEAWLDFLYKVEEDGEAPEQELDAQDLASNWAWESENLKFLACGAYRCVFAIEGTGVVVKLPWETSGKGYDDNLREFEIWQRAQGNDDLEPYLAPAIAVADDGSWLLMREADWAPSAPVHDEWPEEWANVYDAADELGITDLHRANFGRIDGRIVVIDYASNPYSPSSVPDKYVEGVAKGEKKKRRKEIAKRSKKATGDPKAYEDFETDIDPKTGKPYGTKESKHTKAYRKVYGEDAMGSVAKVAKATGIPKKIVKEVYDRGLAAWRTGHRPGASQHAWGLARVYSFATGGKTYKTADADLAKKAKKAGFKPKKKSNPSVESYVERWQAHIEDNFYDFGEDLDPEIPLAFADRTGLELIACGWGRCAFRLEDGSVLKLSYRREGRLQSGYECLRWIESPPDKRRNYAAIYACDTEALEDAEDWELYDDGGMGWVLMEYVKPISKAEFKRRTKEIHDLAKTLGIRDTHWENVGLRNGEIVFLDYGESMKPKSIRVLNPSNRSLIRLAFEGEGWFGVGSSQGIWLVVEGGRAIGGIRTDFEDGGPVYVAGWDPHEALDLSVNKGEWENWYRLFPKRDRWETFDVPCTYAPNCAISEREIRAIRQRVLR